MATKKKDAYPNILISMSSSPLQDSLVEVLSQHATVILFSNEKINQKNVHTISSSSVNFLNKVKEQIDYALFFIHKKEDLKTLKKVDQKLTTNNTKTVIVIDQNFVSKISKDAKKTIAKINPCIAISGDVLYENDSKAGSETSKIFHNAIRKEEIKIHNNPLESLYIFSEEDTRKAIFKLLFTDVNKRNIYLLFYEHPQTYISACNTISKVIPNTITKFDKEKIKKEKQSHKKLIKNTTLLFEKSTQYFKDEIAGFEKAVLKIYSTKNFINTSDSEDDKKEKSYKEIVKFTTVTLSIAILLFALTNIALTYTSAMYALSSIKNIDQADISQSKKNALTSKGLFNTSWPVTSIFNPFSSNKTFQAIGTLSYAVEQVANTYDQILTNPSSIFTDPTSTLSKATSLYFTLSKLNIQAKEPSSTLSKYLRDSSQITSIMQVAPQILGVSSEKKYLLLFQNNNELRPSGGFIGSIGEVTFSNSQITNFKIRDVYQLDGQLTQHVEPHYIVRRHLQPHLYLRDSNFDLEFSSSASKAAQLYFLETQNRVDGVIAINFKALEAVIKEIGPITLHDYEITVTEENLFEFIDSTIENSFFPGSSQKQDVLNSIATHTMLKFEQDPKLYTKVARLFPKLLEEKDIMFAFQNQNMQKLFKANNFTGSIEDERETLENSLNDILYVNEANIGANKANVSVQRKVDYEIFLSENEPISKTTLHLFNNSQNSQIYKSYIRFMVPKGSRAQWVKINDVKQETIPAITDPRIFESETFKPQEALEIEEQDTQTHTIIGLTLTIPPNSTSKIEVLYTNGLQKRFINPINYSLKYIKQPGTKEYSMTTTIHTESEAQLESDTFTSYDNNTFKSAQVISSDIIQEALITIN